MVDLNEKEFEGLFTGLQDMWERLLDQSGEYTGTPARRMHLSLANNGQRSPSSIDR
jgi:hypothetical protein